MYLKIDTIKFKKTAPKNLAMKGKVSSLVITALKQIGKENVSQEVELQLTKVLKKESVENVRHDAKLAPEWISKLIFQLLNNFEK